MKKTLALFLMATLAVAGSAFAVERHFAAAPNATFAAGAPTTTNNDDSCDIGVTPAATLLLPYFQVDVTRPGGQTTLFTITNTSPVPQIAHVTVWSEYSIPVLDFNIFLTGYDVQGINLYDVIVSGVVAPPSGTSSRTPAGALSYANYDATGAFLNNDTNPNFRLSGGVVSTNCGTLPGQLPPSLVSQVLTALTTGAYTAACSDAGGNPISIGGNHPQFAIGYVTVDVANNCSTSLPTNGTYFGTEALFDNTLIGDYQQLGPTPVGGTAAGFDGAGNPMVHIRAIPEGGPANGNPGTNLPYTFYDRYTVGTRTIDRRQPLPSLWAARYIENTAAGFATNLKMWREGKNNGTCADFAAAGTNSGGRRVAITEIVRFDEAENPYTFGGSTICSPCNPAAVVTPEAALIATTNAGIFPQFPSATAATLNGGWMYLNLNNGGSGAYYSSTRNLNVAAAPGAPAPVGPLGAAVSGQRPSQNWVVVEMFGAVGTNRMSVDFDAAWLQNGCSTAAPALAAAGNVLGRPVCPTGIVCVAPAGTVPYAGTNVTP